MLPLIRLFYYHALDSNSMTSFLFFLLLEFTRSKNWILNMSCLIFQTTHIQTWLLIRFDKLYDLWMSELQYWDGGENFNNRIFTFPRKIPNVLFMHYVVHHHLNFPCQCNEVDGNAFRLKKCVYNASYQLNHNNKFYERYLTTTAA